MTSSPPGSCCYKGVKHEGTPTGTYENLGDFEIYIKYPENRSTEKGILMLTDVIGHRFQNVQLIADQFAENGYFVVMPDLFYGDAIKLNRPDGFDLNKWMQGEYHPEKTSHMPPTVDPIVDLCLKTMRSKYGCKKIGAVGYCFGAKYVARFLHPAAGQIDVGFVNHPSFVMKDELEKIEGPWGTAAAEIDTIFTTEQRHESEVILKGTGQPYQITLYSGVEHGFSVRGDPKKQATRYAKETAFLQALQWFAEYLQ